MTFDASSNRTRAPQNWVQSPWWDAGTMLSGLSFCMVLLVFHPFALDVRVAMGLFVADRALGMLHSWSTTWMVMGSKMFAPVRKDDPTRYLKVPLMIFLLSLTLGIWVAKTVNIPDTGEVDAASWLYYFPYIAIFWIGHFWHFGRQDFGVLSLYRARACQFDHRDRLVDDAFAKIMMYVIQPLVFFSAFARSPFTVVFNWLTGAAAWIHPLATISVVTAMAMFSVVFILESRKANRSIGKLLYYVVMLFHPLFLYYSSSTVFVYWHVAYLWSHWIIAITLAARVNTGFELKAGRSWTRALLQHALIVGGVCAVILWVFRPFAGMSLLNADFIDAREIIRTLKPDRYLITGLYFGFGLGEQLVHYYCDRCLFRFRDLRVRNLVAPYL